MAGKLAGKVHERVSPCQMDECDLTQFMHCLETIFLLTRIRSDA